jgi:hypothetical protein
MMIKGNSMIEGWFKEGEIVYGRLIFENIYTYTGEFKNFKHDGYGTAYY